MSKIHPRAKIVNAIAITRLAQVLDDASEFEAADIVDNAVSPSEKYELEPLKQALAALDFKLTGNERRSLERPKTNKDYLAFLYDNQEYYLNDGGYSRVVARPVAPNYQKLSLIYTSNSTDKVKSAWTSASAEIQAVENAANALYNDDAYMALSML